MWKFLGIFSLIMGGIVCWSSCRVSAMAERDWERIMKMKNSEDKDNLE